MFLVLIVKKVFPHYPSCNFNRKVVYCIDKSACPLNGQCLTRAMIYNGIIRIPGGNDKRYIGLVEPVFKGRYSDHLTSFSNRIYEQKTDLSKAYWEALDQGHNITKKSVEFSILKKSHPYRVGAKKCELCLWEKLLILKNEKLLINKRDEFISKCRHVNKFMLKNFKSKHK